MILYVTYKMGSHTRSLRPVQDVSGGCSRQFVSTWWVACRGLNSLSLTFCFLTFSEMKKGCSAHAQMQPQYSVLQGDNIWEFLQSSLKSVQNDRAPLVLRSKFLRKLLLLHPPPASSLSVCLLAPASWVHLLNKLPVPESQHQDLLLGGIQTQILGYKENLG